MNKHYKALEFDLILNELSSLALSNGAVKTSLELKPYKNIKVIREKLNETHEGKKLIDSLGSPPLFSMKEIYGIWAVIEKGDMLQPSQLKELSSFIVSSNRMRTYLKRGEHLNLNLTSWKDAIINLDELKDEIDFTISGDTVSSKASSLLSDTRRKIEFTENRIKVKLDELLNTNKKYLSDTTIVTRGNRYTLPFKKEYKNKISGSVVDISRGGNTCFIEPKSVTKIYDELSILKIEEDSEIRRILYTLTALVEDEILNFNINVDVMEKLDFIFAKAKLSIKYDCTMPEISSDNEIIIENGRHPLLNSHIVVPLDFKLKGRGLIITGPNTGGKTVTLKTIGLFTLMASCGLNVPAKFAKLPLVDNIFCDIGDGQSIEESLSTFSSHMTNIINILKESTSHSMVLLDELGSGTDPDEGMGIAIAILDELMIKSSRVFSTTHYPEVKSFCDKSNFYESGRMAFDKEKLSPLYKLEIGKHGESSALYISKRLGLPQNIIDKARNISNSKNTTKASIDEYIESNNKQKLVKSRDMVFDNPKFKEDKKFLFEIGDSVTLPKGDIGIVYEIADKKGMVGVQIKGKKTKINYKRLKIKVKYYELYPDDYDFSIIFDSVENRKKRHIMGKRHDENIKIEIE